MDFIKEATEPPKRDTYRNNESTYTTTDELLENEKINNQSDNWNKLDKTAKLQKLYVYADRYGEKHNLSQDQILSLKQFLRDAVEKGKFQKAKDVVYNKVNREVDDILSLHWNDTNKNFTLKNLDTKKVSLLKSLTPKRVTSKNKQSATNTSMNTIMNTTANTPVKLCIEDPNQD
jgi:hypothetical protein